MGWGSGSLLASEVWDLFSQHIEVGVQRREAARELIELFESNDCDTIYEADDLVKAAGRKWFEGERG